MNDLQAVMNTMQTGYGDATQGVLDAKVASDVMGTLRERGWVSLEELAAVVLAAGGKVTLTPEHLMEAADATLYVSDDFASGGTVIQARHAAHNTNQGA